MTSNEMKHKIHGKERMVLDQCLIRNSPKQIFSAVMVDITPQVSHHTVQLFACLAYSLGTPHNKQIICVED